MSKQSTLSRRYVLAAGGAVAAGIGLACPAMAAVPEPGGEMAALVRQYFAESDAFNATAGDGINIPYRTDEESNALAEATYEATVKRMAATPVRNAEDALAVIHWILIEGPEFGHGIGGGVFGSRKPESEYCRALSQLEAGEDVPTGDGERPLYDDVAVKLLNSLRSYLRTTGGLS